MGNTGTDTTNGRNHNAEGADIQEMLPLKSISNGDKHKEEDKDKEAQHGQREELHRRTIYIVVPVITLCIVCIITLVCILIKVTNGQSEYTETSTSLTSVLETSSHVQHSELSTMKTSTKPTVHEPIRYVNISGTMTLDLAFTDAFNDDTSEEHNELVGHFYDSVDAIFKENDVLYDQPIVIGFEQQGHATDLYFNISVNAADKELVKDSLERWLKDEKIGLIKIQQVEIDPTPPD